MRKGMVRILTMITAVILTAKAGRIVYGDHVETWYNLNMDRVIERADKALGMTNLYHVREDGVRMYGPWVIVAADKSAIRYTRVDTSLGEGIILDTHNTDPEVYDIAVTW